MKTMAVELTLCSDAEPGTGLAAEVVDQVVPRNHKGQVTIRASHLKGLLRAALEEHSLTRSWRDADLPDRVFGRPGENGDSGRASAIAVTDLVAENVEVRTVSRTAVAANGSAVEGSLRTTEAIPASTVFRGTIRVDSSDPVVEPALRLAFLALTAVGGTRTRGAGSCIATMGDENPKAREIFSRIEAALITQKAAPDQLTTTKSDANDHLGEARWIRLTFKAETPICCPEIPAIRPNVIRSGPSIPASAVQGAILTAISRKDSALATACLGHENCRFWPLLPSGEGEPLGIPTRVSLTHRISKLPDDSGVFAFKDQVIEPYDWASVPSDRPLKSSDGVILTNTNTRRLWRFSDLPRLISAHAVHESSPEGERNLFSVESIAPVVWSGVIALPAKAADALEASIKEDDVVAFGKARSVRGQGRLSLEVGLNADAAEFMGHGNVLVAQEAIALPDDSVVGEASECLKALAAPVLGSVSESHARMGCRFGWNRHRIGRTRGGGARLRATRVFLPGSVIVLEIPLEGEALRQAMLRGVGVGRKQAFGALRPHPGIAKGLFERSPELESISTPGAAAIKEIRLIMECGPNPSPSQISQLASRLEAGDQEGARQFLSRQKSRGEKAWKTWEPFFHKLLVFLDRFDSHEAAQAFELWRDLAKARRGEWS